MKGVISSGRNFFRLARSHLQMQHRIPPGTVRLHCPSQCELQPWSRGMREREVSMPAQVLEVALWWGDTLLDMRHVTHGQSVSVGTSPCSTFKCSTFGWCTDSFNLLTHDGSGLIHVPENASVAVLQKGTPLGAEQVDARLILGTPDGRQRSIQVRSGEQVSLGWDHARFRCQWVERCSAKPTRGTFLDHSFQQILVGTVATHVLFLFMMQNYPCDPDAAEADLFGGARGFITSHVTPTKPPVAKTPDPQKAPPVPRPRVPPRENVTRPVHTSSAVNTHTREANRNAARNSGILAILNRGGGGALAKVFASDGLGTGINQNLHALNGAGVADAMGAGGLSTRGVGPGGGPGVLGIGGISSGPPGGGRGLDVEMSTRGKPAARLPLEKSHVVGGLEKEEIGRVIRRYLNQVRYCYDRELTRNPNLAGKVVVNFTIAGTGKVVGSDVVETSLEDAVVQECILKVMNRMQFPAPRGGGIVVVTHPFIFQSAGR